MNAKTKIEKMKSESKMQYFKDLNLKDADKKNSSKDTLSINIWYNQFGLVYFKSVAL